MIEVHLTAAAFEVVRGGVEPKSRKGGVYKVLMPEGLAAKLDAARRLDEGLSDVILRLAAQAKDPAKPRPRGRYSVPASPAASTLAFAHPL